MDLYL